MNDKNRSVFAEGLVKRYGPVRALDGVDIEVPCGTILGLLGANGAGKTTLVRVLATLVRPDAGVARVAGHDVARRPAAVRAAIAVAGQQVALADLLTGRENLELFVRLRGLGGRAARARAAELLEAFELTEAAARPARTYSGGMRRRLDLAAALVVDPEVLFLDEPTTGLDPRSRRRLWELVRARRRRGTTVVLTTQHLDEADELADRIAVVDRGRVIATGTPADLKAAVGAELVEVTVPAPDHLGAAARVLRELTGAEPAVAPAHSRLSVPAGVGGRGVVEVVRALDAAGVPVAGLGLRPPTLDDVFLTLTGAPPPATRRPGPTGPDGSLR